MKDTSHDTVANQSTKDPLFYRKINYGDDVEAFGHLASMFLHCPFFPFLIICIFKRKGLILLARHVVIIEELCREENSLQRFSFPTCHRGTRGKKDVKVPHN